LLLRFRTRASPSKPQRYEVTTAGSSAIVYLF
jgi:hypothetical protein